MKLTLLVLTLPICLFGYLPFQPEGSVGYRFDSLRWNLGSKDVSVVSELVWDRLQIGEAELRLTKRVGLVSLEGVARGGIIFQGHNRDSDYAKSGRQREWCRATGRAAGYVADLLVSVGRPLSYERSRTLMLTPKVGGAWSRQYLRSRQVVLRKLGPHLIDPIPLGRDGGTIATYRADWVSFWGGILIVNQLSRNLWWEAEGQLHGGVFLGHGNWRLRTLRFRHIAGARAFSGRVRFFWFPGSQTALVAGVQGGCFVADHGSDSAREPGFPDGRRRFNGAIWNSVALTIGLHQLF